MADDINHSAIITYTQRLRREMGEFFVGSCFRFVPYLQRSPASIHRAATQTQ